MPRRFRCRTATLMILVGLIACGLGGRRWYHDALERAKVAQAVEIVRHRHRAFDPAFFDARLGAKSADGATQQVLFREKFGDQNLRVTIVLDGRWTPTRMAVPPGGPPRPGGGMPPRPAPSPF